MEEKKIEKNSTFICIWPKELHKTVKAHAALRNETINNWVMRCVVEQLEREKTYISLDK